MPDLTTYALFVGASLLLAISPGPAVLYIVTRSISQGRGAGLVSCLGICLGGIVHVVAAALGLSAILASSAAAFTAVKYAGAAYLVWLGIRKLRSAAMASEQSVPDAPLSRVFWEGVTVNVLNPKTALFFLAFVPQFVDPSRGPVATQFLFLGTTFLLLALTTDSMFSFFAGGAGSWLKGHPAFHRSERRVSGLVYVGLGVAAAVSGGSRK